MDATEPHPIRIQPIRIGSGSDLDSFCHSVDRPLEIIHCVIFIQIRARNSAGSSSFSEKKVVAGKIAEI